MPKLCQANSAQTQRLSGFSAISPRWQYVALAHLTGAELCPKTQAYAGLGVSRASRLRFALVTLSVSAQVPPGTHLPPPLCKWGLNGNRLAGSLSHVPQVRGISELADAHDKRLNPPNRRGSRYPLAKVASNDPFGCFSRAAFFAGHSPTPRTESTPLATGDRRGFRGGIGGHRYPSATQGHQAAWPPHQC